MRAPTVLARGLLTLCCLSLPLTLLPPAAGPVFQPRQAAPSGGLGPGSGVGQVRLDTSDPKLAAAFLWARRQALAYAYKGDPVGDWYEAALPGREAFCMRDVAHQAMGAQALGLAAYTRNMLEAFARNVSDSKDWCSYWEINRYGRPAPVDYQSDTRFWYDLPANFDVLDACWRMYLWTGDRKYIDDAAFLNFYNRSVSDYVERWALDLDHLMKRPRLMNIRGEFNAHDKFQTSRGIPGYDEGRNDFVVGVDLLAAEYAAYRGYSQIEARRGNYAEAQTFAQKAGAVQEFVNRTWWDAKTGHFYSILDEGYHLRGRNGVDVLYYGLVEDGRRAKAAFDDLTATIKATPSGAVELESHYPEVLYRYGAPQIAYSQIMNLARRGRYRQEYPEVSFSVVGAIVSGLMGISVEAPSPDQSAAQFDFLKSAAMTRTSFLLGIAPPVQWNYVEAVVKTFPSLTNDTAWAEIGDLPVRANVISVKQEGDRKTTVTNQSGPSLIWRAEFSGAHRTLLVNSQPISASEGQEPPGRITSCVQVAVGAGDTVVVEIPPAEEQH